MGPGSGDDIQKRREEPAETSDVPTQDPFIAAADSPLNYSRTGVEIPGSDSQKEAVSEDRSPTLDAVIGENFPIARNIGTRIVMDGGTPIVVLEDGTKPLERYPLRLWQEGDPEARASFNTAMATVQVKWTDTSLDIEVRPRGAGAFLGRWVPGFENLDEWIAFDRETHKPNEITVVQPGRDNRSKVMLYEA